jgi:hypothetical protein
MREEDLWGLMALGEDPPEGLLAAIRFSTKPEKIFFDGELTAIWGVVPYCLLTGHGMPWVLTTAAVNKYPIAFYKESMRVVSELRTRYSRLYSLIDSRHTSSLKWADRLGFKVELPQALGPNGMLFSRVTMEGARP